MTFHGWTFARTDWVALFQDESGAIRYCDEKMLEKLFVAGVDVTRALFGSLDGLPPWGANPSQEQVARGLRIMKSAVPITEVVVE